MNCDFIKFSKDHGVRIEGGADLCHLAARLPRMVKQFGPDSKLSFSLADLCALFLSGEIPALVNQYAFTTSTDA